MTTLQVKEEILRLKKEKDMLIIAHTYQAPDILDVADIVGDSFALSVSAAKYPHKNVLMCGVRFMAETVKILSPEKTVYLSSKTAGCPMAEQILPSAVKKFKEENPNYKVCAYVNTTAELKALADVCVTSSSVLNIVSKIEEKDILFIPDKNLGAFVAKNFPEKNIVCMEGCCPVHDTITAQDVIDAKKAFPNAKVLMHPECRPEAIDLADSAGSTKYILDTINENPSQEYIIATERGVYDKLILKEGNKERLHQLCSEKLTCPDMKKTTLMDVLNVLQGEGGDEVTLDEELMNGARKSINAMIEMG